MHKKTGVLASLICLSAVLGLIDWKTGYELNFFVFYFIPAGLAAWALGIEYSIFLSLLCAAIWFYADKFSGNVYSSNIIVAWNTLIRMCSFLIIGWSVYKIRTLFQSEKIKAENLEKALSQIKILESFLSICCVCKKIRNEEGAWEQMESYISEHSDTTFSHGYCPECAKKAMKEAGLI